MGTKKYIVSKINGNIKPCFVYAKKSQTAINRAKNPKDQINSLQQHQTNTKIVEDEN